MSAPTPTNIDFSDSTPPAPPGRINVEWLASSPVPITVNLNGVDTVLQFRKLSASVPNPGSPGGGTLAVFEIPITATYAGNFTVAHGLTSTPSFVIVQMESGGNIWLQTPGFDGTNLYLTASDAGVSGTAVCFMALPDAVIPISPIYTGDFSLPHGLGATPALALVQMTSGGSIWFQTVPYDATDVNLVASDVGVSGIVYVWLHMPTITVVTSAQIPLAPSAPGNFTVAHGLGKTPTLVIIRMSSGGSIWLQEPPYDASDLYLVASDAGVTGEAEVWTS